MKKRILMNLLFCVIAFTAIVTNGQSAEASAYKYSPHGMQVFESVEEAMAEHRKWWIQTQLVQIPDLDGEGKGTFDQETNTFYIQKGSEIHIKQFTPKWYHTLQNKPRTFYINGIEFTPEDDMVIETSSEGVFEIEVDVRTEIQKFEFYVEGEYHYDYANDKETDEYITFKRRNIFTEEYKFTVVVDDQAPVVESKIKRLYLGHINNADEIITKLYQGIVVKDNGEIVKDVGISNNQLQQLAILVEKYKENGTGNYTLNYTLDVYDLHGFGQTTQETLEIYSEQATGAEEIDVRFVNQLYIGHAIYKDNIDKIDWWGDVEIYNQDNLSLTEKRVELPEDFMELKLTEDEKTFEVVYHVIDHFGRESSYKRNVIVTRRSIYDALEPNVAVLNDIIIDEGTEITAEILLEGVVINDYSTIVVDGDSIRTKNLLDKVTVEGYYDTEIPGEYDLRYIAIDMNGNITIEKRKLIVRDITKPEIVFSVDALVTSPGKGIYLENYIKVFDNVDGEIEKENISIDYGSYSNFKEGTYNVLVTAVDSSGNKQRLSFTVFSIEESPMDDLNRTVSPVVVWYKKQFVTLLLFLQQLIGI